MKITVIINGGIPQSVDIPLLQQIINSSKGDEITVTINSRNIKRKQTIVDNSVKTEL